MGIGLGEPAFNPIRFTDHVEAHLPKLCGAFVPLLISELDTIIGQNRLDPVRHNFKKMSQELLAQKL